MPTIADHRQPGSFPYRGIPKPSKNSGSGKEHKKRKPWFEIADGSKLGAGQYADGAVRRVGKPGGKRIRRGSFKSIH